MKQVRRRAPGGVPDAASGAFAKLHNTSHTYHSHTAMSANPPPQRRSHTYDSYLPSNSSSQNQMYAGDESGTAGRSRSSRNAGECFVVVRVHVCVCVCVCVCESRVRKQQPLPNSSLITALLPSFKFTV